MADLVDVKNASSGSAEWWLGRLAGRLASRQTDMKLFDDYYHGRHRETFKIRQVLMAFGLRQPLHVNYCAVVVDAVNERLGVTGFRFGKDEAGRAAAWEIWQRSNMDAAFKRGLRIGLAKGEFSLLVWPDDQGEPRIFVEDGAQVLVATDPSDRRVRRAAIKRWYDEDDRRTYATIYLPDGLYKFQTPTSAQVPSPQKGVMPDGFYMGGGAGPTQALPSSDDMTWERRVVDGEPWPLPNPFATVPVIPLPNRPGLDGSGESEINLVVPIQDAINANVANVMLAGLYGAFRQKWATNVTLEVDPKTGKSVQPWDVAIDSLMTAPPPADGTNPVQFGEFGQTELSGYISLHEAYVQAIATITRLPVHYLLGSQGSFPSGESLTAAERGLSEKARERAIDDGDPVEEAMRLALRMKASQAGLSNAAAQRYLKWAAMTDAEAVWRDPETKPESAHIDALTKLAALGVPEQAVWAMIPATPQQVAEWTAMKAEAAAAASAPPPAGGSAGAMDPTMADAMDAADAGDASIVPGAPTGDPGIGTSQLKVKV
ncbi:MAG TPA: phage portal protein [Candidatus Limnocylindrales bacterium]|nr:phage portal protein [Candidatus Limnocylindrales bacterium]